MTSIRMKAYCRSALGAALLTALPVWSQASGSPPPVIDGTVPPPSDNYRLGPDSQIHGSVAAGKTYRVHPDGSVDARAPFYDFDIPNWAEDRGAAGIGMDRDGRAYVATRTGVQVFDRNGRVAGIIPLPGNAAATGPCFGGPDFDTLYVAGGGKVYRRKLHSVGAPPWADPFKLPPWGAG
jgi:gluconolactonase